MDDKMKDWLKQRRQGIGSSDAPIIMGVSPWKTPYQLWEDKTGRTPIEKSDGNWATERGNRLEPTARAIYETLNDIEMPAVRLQNSQIPFLIANMDGGNLPKKCGLEIKCPGAEDHQKALDGKLPEKYFPQVQHQLLVSGFDWIDYFSFTDNEKFKEKDRCATIRVYPDIEYQKQLLVKETEFWDYVTNDEAPPLSDKDYVKLTGDAFRDLGKIYKSLLAEKDILDEKIKETKKTILELVEARRAKGCGIMVVRSSRKGAIDYKAVPQLKDVDLEQYRKKHSEVETVTVYEENDDAVKT